MKQLLFILLLLLFSANAGEMVSIPAGRFKMGSSTGDSDEKPVHVVSLSSFRIDMHEVSNAEYKKCVKRGKCTPAHYKDGKCTFFSGGRLKKTKVTNSKFTAADKPVTCVSWKQAKRYCTSVGKRLPTEAEWEYVATKGGTRNFSAGASTGSSATFSSQFPSVVTANSAGAYGVKNMNGNVWEWVQDRYERDYYKYSSEKNPKGASVSRFRSIRGGGWYSKRSQLRSKNRQWYAPEAGEVSLGFRCAK